MCNFVFTTWHTNSCNFALQNNLCIKQSRPAFGKLQILFNKQSRSTQIADIIKKTVLEYIWRFLIVQGGTLFW